MEELREAAEAVRQNSAPQAWITSLLNRAAELGNATIVAGAVEIAKKATDTLFG